MVADMPPARSRVLQDLPQTASNCDPAVRQKRGKKTRKTRVESSHFLNGVRTFAHSWSQDVGRPFAPVIFPCNTPISQGKIKRIECLTYIRRKQRQLACVVTGGGRGRAAGGVDERQPRLERRVVGALVRAGGALELARQGGDDGGEEESDREEEHDDRARQAAAHRAAAAEREEVENGGTRLESLEEGNRCAQVEI